MVNNSPAQIVSSETDVVVTSSSATKNTVSIVAIQFPEPYVKEIL